MKKKSEIHRSRISTKEFNDAIFCKICEGVMEDAQECDICNIGFCKGCIDSWKMTNATCPNNCPNFKPKKAHVLIRNMLDSLEIFCKYAVNGCDKVPKYELLKKHENECEYKLVKCKNDINGCDKKILLKNIKEQ